MAPPRPPPAALWLAGSRSAAPWPAGSGSLAGGPAAAGSLASGPRSSPRRASTARTADGTPTAVNVSARPIPAQANSPPSSAPSNPPKLKHAWNELIIGRR